MSAAIRFADRSVARLERDGTCWAVIGIASVVYAALFLWISRDTKLFIDESQLFVHDNGFDPATLLTPINGHLVFLLRLLHAVAFKLDGPGMTIVRVANIAGHIAVVCLVFAIVKRRLGPPAALALSLLVLFLGSAWEITFTQSGITYIYSVAFGLGALLALERGNRRADLAACALLALAIAMFTFGVAFALGALVMIALGPDWRRRIWVVLVPLALYVVWVVWIRAIYDPPGANIQEIHLVNLLKYPAFVAQAAGAAAGSATGLDYNFSQETPFAVFETTSVFGPVLATAAAIALGARLVRRPASPLLWAALVCMLAIWGELALGASVGRTPETVRYVYPGVVLAIVIGAEATRHLVISRTAVLLIFAAVAIGLCGNLIRLREGADFYREFALGLRAQQSAIELTRDQIDPNFTPGSEPGELTVLQPSTYLPAVDRFGSPAFTPDQLADAPETARAAGDVVFVSGLRLALAPADPATRQTRCRQLSSATGAPVEVSFGAPGITLEGAGAVALRRYASSTTVPLGDLTAGQPTVLRIPQDGSSQPWTATISSSQPVRVCALG